MNSTSSIPAPGAGYGPAAASADGPLVIPVLEERVKVARRTVESGRATRVRKVVREDRQELELPTVHEEVQVERVPVGRLVDGPLESWEEDGVLVIPVVEERLVVRTEHVLREEIRISRRRRTQTSVHAVTLRREVAIVERLDPATGDWAPVDSPPSHRNEPGADTRIPHQAPERAPLGHRKTLEPGPTPQGA
ncbi:MAG: YsnF/AvaK domain-containing protein [Steroidobacteraceae bacterium]|jgi:uncharacterized protein (TIGR02271 family)|nr:YsnF/AvaK domain-containing protein [Steroidobacteraceae bacterium]